MPLTNVRMKAMKEHLILMPVGLHLVAVFQTVVVMSTMVALASTSPLPSLCRLHE